jgi:predicted metal-dependent peptidase
VHTPWERVLGRLLARAVADTPRPSWRRPAGRWLAMEAAARAHGGPVPVFQPSLRREGLRPRIAVCLDASASIDDGRLALFAAQVAGIARRTGAEVHLLVFDEAVRAREVLRPGRIEAAIAGVRFARGGGTAFAPALAEAAAAEPAIVVVLTDLEGPPGEPPGRVPVLWAVPEAPAGPPPFGRVIALDR